MKVDQKHYRVEVQNGVNHAGLICTTYNLGTSTKFVGVEYFQLTWNFNNSSFVIPHSRQATFQEELRACNAAASTFEGDRSDEKKHIESKLKEAYGDNAIISIEDIELPPM